MPATQVREKLCHCLFLVYIHPVEELTMDHSELQIGVLEVQQPPGWTDLSTEYVNNSCANTIRAYTGTYLGAIMVHQSLDQCVLIPALVFYPTLCNLCLQLLHLQD